MANPSRRALQIALAAALACAPDVARAACNLIPPADPYFPSSLGKASAPIGLPGEVVTIVLDGCKQSPSFSATAANDVTEITFFPPCATPPCPIATVSVSDVTPSSCAGGLTSPCNALSVRLPDTTGLHPPDGYAGPAKISVFNDESGTPILAAEIFALYQPTQACDRIEETVFHTFVVLPPPNSFADLVAGTTSRLLATLDGDGDLLVPFDYKAVLPLGSAAPVARFVSGSTTLRARSSSPAPLTLPSSDFIRSFTVDGRPLPPLLRTDATGRVLFGATDAERGILRFARRSPDGRVCIGGPRAQSPCTADDQCAPTPCGPASCVGGSAANQPCSRDADCPSGECGHGLYDFTDRLSGGGLGPIVIDRLADGVQATSGPAVPLRGLRSSPRSVGYARDEAIEGLDLNGDGDTRDRIVQLVDAASAASTNTGQAVIEVRSGNLAVPAIETDGAIVAYLESESMQGATAENGDGDAADAIVRVFDLSSGSAVERTSGLDPRGLTADAGMRVNRRSLAISEGLVFFRTPESGRVPQLTVRASEAPGGADPDGDSAIEPGGSVSADGRLVAFESLAENIDHPGASLRKAFVFDRVAGTRSRVSVDDSGNDCLGNQEPVLSGDGRYAAFVGRCPTVPGIDPAPPAATLFLRDRCVFSSGASIAGCTPHTARVPLPAEAPPPGTQWNLEHARLSYDGRFVAYEAIPYDLATGSPVLGRQVFLEDRDADEDGVLDEAGAGEVATLLASVAADGVSRGDGDSTMGGISTDGRYVAFESGSSNLVPGSATSGANHNVFVRDSREPSAPGAIPGHTILASAAPDGRAMPGNETDVSISGDGRFVAFDSPCGGTGSNTCPQTGNSFDVFVHDRDPDGNGVFDEPGATANELANVSSSGDLGAGSPGWSINSSLSRDGRFVAFLSNAPNLVPGDTNGALDVFVRDRVSGTTERASVSTAGAQITVCADPLRCTRNPVLSADGAVVAFHSESSELVANDLAGHVDVFVRAPDPSAASFDLDGDGSTADVVLQVFNPRTGALRSLPRKPAAEVAVAAGRALFVTPDPAGDFAQLYDGSPSDLSRDDVDSLEDLGVAANRVALSPEMLALTSPAGPRDELRVRSVLGGGPPVATGLGADAIAVVGRDVVFASAEATEGGAVPPGEDLDGDGDTSDRVLRIFRDGALAIRTGEPVDDFLAVGHLVAFRTPECALGGTTTVGCPSGGTDLNGDGDSADEVMQVYDLSTSPPTLLSTGQAAIPCTIPGCEPGVPYRIKGDTVAFLTSECDQGGPTVSASCPAGGTDLDGNGVVGNIVVQMFNVKSQRIQVFTATATAPDVGQPVPPLPDTLLDDPILYVSGSELDLGVDLDGDHVLSDRVLTFVVGDQDKDGSFDVAANADDSCVEVSNAEQLDSDLDGIGDECDASPYCSSYTPEAPARAPASAARCQKAIGRAAAAYLSTRSKAVDACLRRLAAGKTPGEATATCRGPLLAGVRALPADAKTAERLVAAEEKFHSTTRKPCKQDAPAQLDLCASPNATLGSLSLCVLASYAEAATAASEVAYRAPGAIANGRDRRCALGLAAAAGHYLDDVIRTMGRCLDALNDGKLSGSDPRALCLGRGDAITGDVEPLADPKSAKSFAKAGTKLRAAIAGACPADVLTHAAVDACGGTADAVASCIECSQWRRAVESLHASYGPGPR